MIITRRRLLQGVGATGVLAAVGCGPRGGQPQVPPIPIPAKPILVVVDIDGGNDWLNMMPPLSGTNRSVYESKRPSLAVPPQQTTALDNGAGLNADFAGMAELDALGRIAWIPGIGMNNPNLSHFVSIDLWGQGAAQPGGTGWLGRFADVFGQRADFPRRWHGNQRGHDAHAPGGRGSLRDANRKHWEISVRPGTLGFLCLSD